MQRHMRRLVVALAVLALAAAAEAKGPGTARVCGSSGCITVRNLGTIDGMTALSGPFQLADAPRPVPFYTVALSDPPPSTFRWSFVYAPSRHLLRISDGVTPPYWRRAPTVVARTLARLTRGLEPYPRSRGWNVRRPAVMAPTPLLAITGQGPAARLVPADPVSLRPAGRSTQVGRYVWPWSRSPDGSRVALGAQQPAGLRFVDLNRMRTLGAVRLSGHDDVSAVTWVRPRLVLAAVGLFFVVAVDPVAQRVLWTRTLPNEFEEVQRSATGFVFLAPPSGADGKDIGPTTLVSVDAAGAVRSAVLDRIQSGFHHDEQTGVFIGEQRRPGLAVDPVGNRAYVVGAGEPVAEIDLATMTVAYHGGSRSPEKALSGPIREARWLANGQIAVTGYDTRAWIDSEGQEQELTTPAGLTLIDTRSWTSRPIDPDATSVAVSGELLLAYAWSYDATVAQASGIGVAAYALDGTPRFHVLDGPVASVQAGAGLAYIWRPVEEGSDETRLAIVDLAAGRVLRTVSFAQPPLLLIDS